MNSIVVVLNFEINYKIKIYRLKEFNKRSMSENGHYNEVETNACTTCTSKDQHTLW